MTTPNVVIVHEGNQDYVNIAVDQAKRSGNDTIRIGLERLSPLSVQFDASYRHMSTNSRTFEVQCFRRYFAVQQLMQDRNLQSIFHLDSDNVRPTAQPGWTSADAAGLPILPGLVRVSEVQAGAIEHALRFTVSRTQQAFIHPATHAAGSRDTALPPMGLRLRLKASFSLASFSGAAKVILTAMQQYGLLLADNGGNWFVSGDSDDAWTPLMSEVNAAFGQVHGGDFEAVDTGPLN